MQPNLNKHGYLMYVYVLYFRHRYITHGIPLYQQVLYNCNCKTYQTQTMLYSEIYQSYYICFVFCQVFSEVYLCLLQLPSFITQIYLLVFNTTKCRFTLYLLHLPLASFSMAQLIYSTQTNFNKSCKIRRKLYSSKRDANPIIHLLKRFTM